MISIASFILRVRITILMITDICGNSILERLNGLRQNSLKQRRRDRTYRAYRHKSGRQEAIALVFKKSEQQKMIIH